MSSKNIVSQSIGKTHSHYKEFFRKINWKLFFLLVLPLILLISSSVWLFASPLTHYIDRWNYIDCWIYFGYFLDFKHHLRSFADAYYGTRLPWILPGFLAYKLFPPLTAAYVLHLGFYWAAVISLFLILKHSFDKRTALLVAMLMGCYHYFLEAIGNTYIDGAGITYFLLTLWMLTKGARSQRFGLYLPLAGVFFGCMVYTQLLLAMYTPLIILYYFFIGREYKKKPFLNSQLLFSAGFFGLTLLLCILNYIINRRFFFFLPVFSWLGGFVASGVNPWWSPLSTWWKSAIWLFLPALTFCSSIAVLIFHRKIRAFPKCKAALFFQIFFILNLIPFVFMEFVLKQPVLYLTYYISYALPSMFFALGSQLYLAVHLMSRKQFYTLFGLAAAAMIGGFVFPKAQHWIYPLTFDKMAVSVVFGVLGLAAMFFSGKHARLGAAFLVIASIAVSNMQLNNSKIISYDAAYQKDALIVLAESVEAIKKMAPRGKVYFWYDLNQYPLGWIYRSISSTYLWAYRLMNENFPSLSGEVFARIPLLNDRIFILSEKENALDEANKSLFQIGLKGEFLEEQIFQRGGIYYKIIFCKVSKLVSDSEDP